MYNQSNIRANVSVDVANQVKQYPLTLYLDAEARQGTIDANADPPACPVQHGQLDHHAEHIWLQCDSGPLQRLDLCVGEGGGAMGSIPRIIRGQARLGTRTSLQRKSPSRGRIDNLLRPRAAHRSGIPTYTARGDCMGHQRRPCRVRVPILGQRVRPSARNRRHAGPVLPNARHVKGTRSRLTPSPTPNLNTAEQVAQAIRFQHGVLQAQVLNVVYRNPANGYEGYAGQLPRRRRLRHLEPDRCGHI